VTVIDPWRDAMHEAGIGDPRNGEPSWTQLAFRSGLSVSTVTNAVRRRAKASPGTIQALAFALRVAPEQVSEWIGQAPSPVGGPYVPVPEAAFLTQAERAALDDFLRAIARGRR
jgi:transcriptional regulator with XRE-family HTH domain